MYYSISVSSDKIRKVGGEEAESFARAAYSACSMDSGSPSSQWQLLGNGNS